MNSQNARRAVLIALCLGGLTGCAHHRAVVVREPAPVVYVQEPPPPARIETRTPPPAAGYAWTPGYWEWNGKRYVWHSGQWVLMPRANAYWVEGHWDRQGRGWVWVPGHWQ